MQGLLCLLGLHRYAFSHRILILGRNYWRWERCVWCQKAMRKREERI